MLTAGKKNNLVALNRHSGDLIWSSPGKGELSAYSTPLLFEHNGRKMLATHTKSHLMAFDATTGEMLWAKNHPNEYSVHPNTPVYYDGGLFFLSGYGKGGGMLELAPDGNSFELKWRQKTV